MAEYRLLIPKERIGVVIGKGGEVKREIEQRLGVKVEIEGEEITIRGPDENPLAVLRAKDIVLAMGRGFSPERAFRLFDESQYLEIIDMTEYVSDRALERMRGRVIGEGGKARRALEERLKVWVSVYGKTVSLIGDPEAIRVARRAVEMLLEGAQHSTFYKFLERESKRLREASEPEGVREPPANPA
ncbi:MAG: KH domain-containing protein [Candidatus Hadarchaeales archaeon]